MDGKFQTGWRSPEKIDNALHIAQLQYFNELLQAFPKDEQTEMLLRPFMQTSKLTYDATLKAFPAELYTIDALLTATGTRIEKVPTHQWSFKLKSTISSPTKEYPAYRHLQGGKIEVVPEGAFPEVYAYRFVTPTFPKWAYDRQGSQQIYNDNNSTDLQWNEQALPLLINRTLKLLGISVRDEQLVQYSQVEEAQAADRKTRQKRE